MRVFVAGATGAIGRPLVAALRAGGHDVIGMTRSPEHADALRQSGVEAVVCDALEPEPLVGVVREARPDAVIHQLTHIPPKINTRRIVQEFWQTNRLRREGTRNLIRAAMAAGARRFLAQSIAFAYRPGPGALREETDPLFLDAPAAYREVFAAVADLEAAVLGEGSVEATVLRYGFLLGPGTGYAPGGSFWEEVRRRRVPVVGNGAGVWSFIHVEDAAAATVRALERGATGVYNIVDDHPSAAREWLPGLAEIAGARPPRHVPAFLGRLAAGAYGLHVMTAMPGASNRKAREELDWSPRYPSWREGMGAA